MLAARLIQLIENHAKALTHEAMQDPLTNEHTVCFRRVPQSRPRTAHRGTLPESGEVDWRPEGRRNTPGIRTLGADQIRTTDPVQRNRLCIDTDQEAPAEVHPRTRASNFFRGSCYTRRVGSRGTLRDPGIELHGGRFLRPGFVLPRALLRVSG
jgi:hypothetical protein